MEDTIYYTKHIAEDGSVYFTPTDMKPEGETFFSSKTPTPTKRVSFATPAKSPLITRSSPVFEEERDLPDFEEEAAPSMSKSPARGLVGSSFQGRSPYHSPFNNTVQDEEETYYTPRSPARMTPRASPARMTPRSPARMTPRKAPEEMDLIDIPNTDITYVPPASIVDPLSVVTFYAEMVGQNLVGVVVQDDDAVENLLNALGANEKQRDTPRLIHYLQLAMPVQTENAVFWGIGSPIIKINMADPVRGKIEYVVAEKDDKFFAIVIIRA